MADEGWLGLSWFACVLGYVLLGLHLLLRIRRALEPSGRLPIPPLLRVRSRSGCQDAITLASRTTCCLRKAKDLMLIK